MKTIILILALLTASTSLADELNFEFKNKIDSQTIAFTEDLAVKITGVNQYDFDYKYSVVGLEAKKGDKKDFGPWTWTSLTPPAGFVPLPTIPVINKHFKERMAIFDQTKWASKNDQLFTLLIPYSLDDKAKKLIPADGLVENNKFYLEVDGVDLTKAAKVAGPGGVIVITVEVTPMLSIATQMPGNLIKIEREAGNKNDPAIKDHIETHTYRIHFKPKKGIRTSVGPFISGVKRKSYDKVLAPGGGETSSHIVAPTAGGNSSSGVSINWNVDFFRPCPVVAFGLQWGLAYSPQKEADEQILGLMGLCIYPGNQETVYLSVGVAFGKETILTGGWEEKDPIEPDQEIPTSSRFIGRGYFGMAFNF